MIRVHKCRCPASARGQDLSKITAAIEEFVGHLATLYPTVPWLGTPYLLVIKALTTADLKHHKTPLPTFTPQKVRVSGLIDIDAHEFLLAGVPFGA